MVLCQSVINLRDSFYYNPPKATFLLCLLSLAFSFICLSSYTYTHILPNPDTTKDWNRLLSSLSQFQLCMKATASSELVAPTSSRVTSRYNSNTSPNAPVITLHLKVPLAVTANLHNGSLEGLGLQTTLRAEQLHLGGIELVNLTLQFSCGVDGYTCLTVSAPVHILPIDMLPPDCPKYDKNISYIQVEASNEQPNASQTCYSLNFKNDPTLTVMLTWVQYATPTGTNGVSASSVGSQCVSTGNLLCTLCSFLHEIFTSASLQLDQTGSIKLALGWHVGCFSSSSASRGAQKKLMANRKQLRAVHYTWKLSCLFGGYAIKFTREIVFT